VYSVLVCKRLGKRPLLKPERKWEENVKMNLRDAGFLGWCGGPTGSRSMEDSARVLQLVLVR
jgi:hypothetical protein